VIGLALKEAPVAFLLKSWSLRARVYAVAAVAILLAWVFGGMAIFSSAQREYERMCHENLASLAETVLRFSEHELHEVSTDQSLLPATAPVHSETAATLGQRYAYQIWSANGELLLRSVRAPESEPMGKLGTPGLSHRVVGGRPHEIYVLRSAHHGMEVHVWDNQDEPLFLSRTFMADLGLAFALSMLPVLLGTWLLVRGAFDSLVSAASQLRGRSPGDTTPVDARNPPLIKAINELLSSTREAIDKERSFTALAAHELRTPLAALRVQAQVLARALTDEEKSHGSTALYACVDRSSRLVTQLLELARADALVHGEALHSRVPLDEACAEVLSDFVDEAARRDIKLTCQLDAPAVLGDAVGVQTLLRNLLSNAMKHTPDSGSIVICAQNDGTDVVLRVDDSGKGIPEGERVSVFRRFYRGLGPSGIGVGLGLAIVSSIVQAHRAVVRLGSAPLGGLRVEVRFPAMR
jgi:two-component system, OmpR family, sensor kinase